MTLVDFKLSADRFLEIVRETVTDTKNVTIPEPPDAGEWEQAVNYRQVIRCLEDGELITEPVLDDFNNWQASLQRFSAGVMAVVTIALARKQDRWHIYVIEVKHE